MTNEDTINEEEEFEDAVEELPPISKLTKEAKENTESNNMREAIEILSRWNSITGHNNTYGLELDWHQYRLTTQHIETTSMNSQSYKF